MRFRAGFSRFVFPIAAAPIALMTAVAILAAAAAPAAGSAAAPASAVVQVKGSDTIGGKLGQEFARAFMTRHPEVQVKWEALGSGTAFVGLLDGSAQLGASSRVVKESELADAHRMGVELREYVIGYDGIAVIVNPQNPVAELTVAQLSDLFTGKLRNWSEVGGPDVPVKVITRPSYSGTFSFFREKVLRRGNDKGPEDYATGAQVIEENGALIKAVAEQRGAVSYVGIGWVTAEVKALGVAPKAGQPAIRASTATVRTGAYPIYRSLLMYSRGEAAGPARELLAFILSDDGRKLVAKEDFVPPDVATAPPSGGASPEAGGGAGSGAPGRVRILFPRGTELTAEARTALAALAESVKAAGDRLLVAGHADARGSRAANRAVSLGRARAVAGYLEDHGVPAAAIQVEGHGSDEPVGSNQSGSGRGENRRVDVTVLPAAAH